MKKKLTKHLIYSHLRIDMLAYQKLFFPFSLDETSVDKVWTFSTNGCFITLTGEKSQCKTSLLFQAAVTLSTKNDQVIFIRPKHLDKLPLHVHGMPSPKPLAMQHVKLMYMWSVSDLVQYLARIHMNSVIPAAILVDDLDHYVTQLTKETSTEQAFAKLGVLLKDAADFCSKKRDDQCLVLAACKLPEQGNLFHSIYEQFGDVWNINRGEVSTQRQNLFLTMSSNLQYKTFFYIEDEQIFLDKLTRKTGVFC